MTLRDKMLAVIADTNDSVAEREELVEMIAIALLTRKNLFVLGEPGQAKSYAINLFRRHITGARQFERLLSKQSDEEQLFGRVDLASLLPGSVPPTVLEQDATYQNQRFNLRVLVEGIGSMKDEPATWEKLKSGTEKLELYRAALSALHKSEPTVQTAGKIPEADIVLLAMGFLRPVQPEFPANVFVAGDAATGASLVVKCIAGGRKAAADIDAYLSRK